MMTHQERGLKPLHNTPSIITEMWMEEVSRNSHLFSDDQPPIIRLGSTTVVETTYNDIPVLGVVLINGVFYAGLNTVIGSRHLCDKIEALTVCPSDKGLIFRPIFHDESDERAYSKYGKILQTSDFPVSGVGAFIIRHTEAGTTECLLARRTKGPPSYLNRLSNFGGAVDLGETIWESLRRELSEEVNLLIPKEPVGGYLSFDETIERWRDAGIYHAFSTTYAFIVNDPEVIESICNKEPQKATDFGWYDLEWLKTHREDLTPLLSDSLDAYLADTSVAVII